MVIHEITRSETKYLRLLRELIGDVSCDLADGFSGILISYVSI